MKADPSRWIPRKHTANLGAFDDCVVWKSWAGFYFACASSVKYLVWGVVRVILYLSFFKFIMFDALDAPLFRWWPVCLHLLLRLLNRRSLPTFTVDFLKKFKVKPGFFLRKMLGAWYRSAGSRFRLKKNPGETNFCSETMDMELFCTPLVG